jgi:hypothetical protein
MVRSKSLVTLLPTLALFLFAGSVRAGHIDLPVKWSQLPELIQPVTGGAQVWYGVDHPSHFMAVVMADDFISDGRPIVAVRWWGSYLQTGPAPYEPPVGFVVPFDISFHLSTGTHPNSLPAAQPLGFYSAVLAQEHYTGYVDQAGHPVFEYNAYLDPWFPEVAGQEYFLDIDLRSETQWGWHDAGPAGSGHPIMDWAASAPTHGGPWSTYEPNTDLAFELMTTPEPATWILLGTGLLCAALGRRRR